MQRRPKIIDAEFEVVRGPARPGTPHATRKGWYFTGKYDANGDPLFIVWWLLLMEAVGGTLALLFGLAALGLGSLVAIGMVFSLGFEAFNHFTKPRPAEPVPAVYSPPTVDEAP